MGLYGAVFSFWVFIHKFSSLLPFNINCQFILQNIMKFRKLKILVFNKIPGFDNPFDIRFTSENTFDLILDFCKTVSVSIILFFLLISNTFKMLLSHSLGHLYRIFKRWILNKRRFRLFIYFKASITWFAHLNPKIGRRNITWWFKVVLIYCSVGLIKIVEMYCLEFSLRQA